MSTAILRKRTEIPAWIKPGAPCWYEVGYAPHVRRYAGFVGSAPRPAGDSWTLYLERMDDAYARTRDSGRRHVPAAAIEALSPRHEPDGVRTVTPVTVHLDNGTCWPRADADPDEREDRADSLSWKLRYAPERITPSDMLVAASYIDAYGALVRAKSRDRDRATRALRKVGPRGAP